MTAASMEARGLSRYDGVLHVGVDLGTAYTVVVLDEQGHPLVVPGSSTSP